MTLGRSLLWFIIGVIWVCAAFAIVYAQNSELEQRATGETPWQTTKRAS
jgi:hypothetical protein